MTTGMSTTSTAAGLASADDHSDTEDRGLVNRVLAHAPMLIVITAVLFNPLLAFINGNVRPLTSMPVMAAEVLIVLAAHAYAYLHFDRRMRIWHAYLAFLGTFTMVRYLATGALEIRYFRDLLMVPTFVVLGMTVKERAAIRTILILMAFVVAGVLLEAISTDLYSTIFHVKEYYVNTRGMSSEEFTNAESTLFVSATRPDARFFPFFDLHRLSSIYLEPVSLGNFAILMVAFTMAFWPRLSLRQRVFMALSIVLLLFASDGRLSAVASVLVVAICLVGRALPRNAAMVYLPVVTGATVAAAVIGDFKIGTDDLQGRLAHTSHYLAEMSLSDFLGASDLMLSAAEDSGIIYVMLTQSFLGLLVWWGLVVAAMPETSSVHRNYKNGICLYMALIMMISFAFVTIKTASVMWFIYGFLAGRGGDALAAEMQADEEEAAEA